MALSKLTTVLNKISTMATLIKDQAATVKSAFDYDVNVVKDYINDTLIPEIEADYATTEDLQALVIGEFGSDFVTEAMMANEMKKDIAGGTTSYNSFVSRTSAVDNSLDVIYLDLLAIKLRQTGLNLDTNAWSDTLEDVSGINASLSNGYLFDSTNKSIKLATGIDENTKLMLHCNGANNSTTFTDSSFSPKTVTANGDAKVSTAQSKFGGASAYFDGTGDYLSLSNHADFAFGSGDFTIDLWAYPTANVNGGDLISKTALNSFGPFRITQDGSGNWVFFASSNGSGWDIASFIVIGTVTLNTWQHIAVSRSGNSIRLFKNGVLGNTITTSSAFAVNTENVNIGRLYFSTPSYYQGYIDEIRIIKGAAVWTSAFSVPTNEYGSGTATVLWNAVTSSGVLGKAIVQVSQALGTGTLTYYISRDGGTTFTECSLDTIVSITSQPSGTSIVLKVVITGNAEVFAVAWGGERID